MCVLGCSATATINAPPNNIISSRNINKVLIYIEYFACHNNKSGFDIHNNTYIVKVMVVMVVVSVVSVV